MSEAKSLPSQPAVQQQSSHLWMSSLLTVEERRIRDIYWAIYRLSRRDVRSKWKREVNEALAEGTDPSTLPLARFSTNDAYGALTFNNFEFRSEFAASFGTAELPSQTIPAMLAFAKKHFVEGVSEESLVAWLQSDYESYHSRNQQYLSQKMM